MPDTQQHQGFRCAVLTVSDRASRGTYEDLSGPALIDYATTSLNATIADTAVLPDEPDLVAATLVNWTTAQPTIDLILTTGGTGLSPRDHTPEAAMQVIDRPWPGLLELARLRTAAITELAYLSRGVAGIARNSLIITLPGSPKGALEQLQAITPVLLHGLHALKDQPDCH